MVKEEERLQKEIAELLEQAQQANEAENKQHGKNHSGQEIPDELAHRESRLKKIQEAKAVLEAQAREKARAHAAKLKAEGKTPRKDPAEAVPKDKDQRNFTDPESKIMKTSNKGFDRHGRTTRDAAITSSLFT